MGIGTLYRHFPTREALVEAAYRDELAKVCAAAPGLLADMEPHAALRAWMDRFVDYMSTKIGMADALREVIASGRTPYQESRQVLNAAIKLLLEAGIDAGSVRSDVPTDDILIFLSGVAMASEGTGDAEQAGRLLDLFMDGLMTPGSSSAPLPDVAR